MTRWFLALVLATGPGLLSGCYSFRGGSVASHLKTIAIPLFDDQSGSAEPGLREKFTNKLIDRFRQDNSLEVTDKTRSDSVIEGIIISLVDDPYVVVQGESVTQRKVTIAVKATYRDAKLNKQVWDKQLSNWGTYELGGGAEQRLAGIDAAIDKLTEDILNETVSSW
ncbi:MAG TPA: LptE family protein [Bacteroidota bacterium]|jgi:hypothetical protein|nr:LptE family protein [Bacteroidota bacterium]